MSEEIGTQDFENLQKIAETILEISDDDQIVAPTKAEVAEELGVPENEITRLTDGDYNQAVRTSGLIPNKNRTAGDIMVVYNKLHQSGRDITKSDFRESPVEPLVKSRKCIRHDQAREKLGLEPNPRNNHSGFHGKLYGEDGENYEHRLRTLFPYFDETRFPTTRELKKKITEPKDKKFSEVMQQAGLYAESISWKDQEDGCLSAERENEVFDFWVNEYLEEDWSQYEETEVDKIMRLRMARRAISEDELNEVAEEYSKWVDFERYQNQ